jgi:hypothetical protein
MTNCKLLRGIAARAWPGKRSGWRGLEPDDQAAAILAQIGQVTISASSMWRRVQVWGSQFAALEAAERPQANALPEKWTPPSGTEKADQRMGVAMDGFMVHSLDEGGKEMKLGAAFDVELRVGRDERTGGRTPLAHAVNSSYAAHWGGPEVFGELVFAEVRRRGWEQAQDTQGIGDGAAWIWNQAGLHFGASRQLVDWYHAKQHLAAAARLFKGEGTPAYTLWFNSRETALYQGHAERIAGELAQATPAKPDMDRRSQAGGRLLPAAPMAHELLMSSLQLVGMESSRCQPSVSSRGEPHSANISRICSQTNAPG